MGGVSGGWALQTRGADSLSMACRYSMCSAVLPAPAAAMEGRRSAAYGLRWPASSAIWW